jgi:hypothetical protein
MPAQVGIPERVELSTACPENFLLIENHAQEVLIRAARDNFSSQQKLFFIRYLAAEGYIPENYQSLASCQSELESRIKWLVNDSWIESPSGHYRKAQRQILCLIGYAGLLLAGLLSLVGLFSHR